MYLNWRMRAKYAHGEIDESIGSTHSWKSLEESLAYIDWQYSDYLTYANLGPAELADKKVLEIGFGDNVGVALKFLADGAGQVVCVDKFYSCRDEDNERVIYEKLRATLGAEQQRRFDSVVDLSNGIKIDEQKLRRVYGKELPEFASGDELGSYDIIVSRAVIEEIYDPAPLFAACDRLLPPGGLMIHKIDLSDYHMFSGAGMNPLTFLTISEWIYRRMASSSGIPNRKLLGYYRDLVRSMGYDVRVFASNIIGVGDIKPYKETISVNEDYGDTELAFVKHIRPKLSPEFAVLPDEELLVSGIFMVARKPQS
jgi:SAM-dependent methyltransferase